MDPQPVGLVGAALGVPALFSMTWPGGLVYSHGSEICSAGRDIDCCSLGRLTRLNQLEAVPFSSIVDAPRARSRPPPPPRRPPLTAAIATIPALITNATPVAITASDCATIDATLASTTAPSRRPAPHGRGPLGTVTTASTVDFQGPPPPQPSPPSPPSPLPPSWPQPPALPSVATCGRPFRPSRPLCTKNLGS